MKVRDTLILLALVALLGGYVLLFERGPMEPESGLADANPTPRPTVLAFDLDEVRELLLEEVAPGRVTRLRYDHEDERWWIVEPVDAAADTSTVSWLAESLSRLAANRVLGTEGGSDIEHPPDEYGLAPPAYRAAVTMADGTVHRLEIGAETLDASGFYARVPEGPVVIIAYWVGSDVARHIETLPLQPTPVPTILPATPDS